MPGLCFVVLLILTVLPLVTHAATNETLYQTGFEPPAFTPGLPIRGQDNWEMLHNGEAISVSTNDARTGAQCLRFHGSLLEPQSDGTSLALCHLSPNALASASGGNPLRVVEIQCNVRLDGPQTGTNGSPTNDLMSANFYAAGTRYAGGFIVSSAGRIWTVSFAAGEAYKYSVPYTLGTYRTLTLRVNYLTRMLTYLVDGVALGSSPINPANTDDQLTRADLIMSGPTNAINTPDINYLPTNYTTYFDDYQIKAQVLPTVSEIAQQAYLKASNTGAADWFGFAVAVSGDRIVVGAPYEDSNARGVNGSQNNNSASEAGAAYVFVRRGTNWFQEAYLKASNTQPGSGSFGSGAQFGYSVAISGNTIVIGAPYEDSNATGVNGQQTNSSVTNSGAAYVFVRQGTNWLQQAYLKARNAGAEDLFGVSVAVSGDTIAVGAEGEDSNANGVNGDESNNSARDSGAGYIFVREGTNWMQQAYLKASNTGASDGFGGSVSAASDTVVIGAFREDSNATGVNGNQTNNNAPDSGAAYVFGRAGTNWTQQAYLKASNTGASDNFGSVTISGDTVVVGALNESSDATGVNGNQANNSAQSAGAAYVFVRHGSNWSQQAYLKASNSERFDLFGYAVAIEGDTIVVGALDEDSGAMGVDGNQTNNIVQTSGAAYVFIRNGTNWTQRNYLKASNTGANDFFGISASISDDTVVVGAYWERSNARGVNGNQLDNSAENAGAAYVFTGFAPTPVPPPEIVSILPGTNGLIHLAASTATGRSYTLQSSETLTNWTDLTTRTATTNRIDFTDAPTNAPARRFYRVKQD